MELIRGDDATLTTDALAATTGDTLAGDTFQVGDVLTFTLRVSYGGTLLLTVADGSITRSAPTGDASIAVTAGAWSAVSPLTHTLRNCVWDLQRSRSGVVTTVLRGTLDVLPDVTTS